MDALPDWPDGTVAVLTTRPAHAIPISLVRRAGDRCMAVGLDEIAAHDQPSFEITAGVAWCWTDHDAERRDEEARDALRRLAP